MSLAGLLDIAKTALLASQTAISTVSHNIANVNTPGYSRQRTNLTAAEPVVMGGYNLGTGVMVADIERVYDRFVSLQIIDATELKGRYSSMKEALHWLESIFNDPQGLGLSQVLTDFFQALNEVANDPASYPSRAVLLEKAEELAARIRGLYSQTKQALENLDSKIGEEIEEINHIASRIGYLNVRIQEQEAGGQTANDLRDERDRLLSELAERIDINILEEDTGMVKVWVAEGHPLVAGKAVTPLTVEPDPDNGGYLRIKFGDRPITDRIEAGRIRGLIEARDRIYQDILRRLDTLAASLTKEFNLLHRQGFGLDGSTGLDFFHGLSASVTPKASNRGGATANATIYDLSLLTLNEYEIRFTSPSTYSIVDITQGTTLSSGQQYIPGEEIELPGIRLVIDNGAEGGPQAGDVFRVSVTRQAALNFTLTLTDPNKFAAATDPAALPGDNSNVLAMISLEDTKVLAAGSASFIDFYNNMVVDIGLATSEADLNDDVQQTALEELENYRESISGVSLDEEGLELIKYQHAYQAAAAVIEVANELFERLVELG